MQSESSTAPQIVTKDAGSVVALTAIAREVVFQELSSQLFQVNGASAYDRVSTNGITGDLTTSDESSGLLRSADESMVDEIVDGQEAVLRELDAVDAVLQDLHDLDLLLPSVTDIEIPLDMNMESASDGLLGGEIDGGMVLLQATGDANANVFAASPADLKRLAMAKPAKMEVAVGMFQAMDVAVGEAPHIESAPRTSINSAAASDAKRNESLPGEREQTPSHKAVALIGATTLTGALVGANRLGSRRGRKKPTARNRRVPHAE